VYLDDKEGRWGANNSKDEVVIRPKYERLQVINENLYLAQKSNGESVIIDQNGEVVKQLDDYKSAVYYNGVIYAKVAHNKYELLDTEGKLLSQEEFIIDDLEKLWTPCSWICNSDYFNAEELAQKIVSALTTKGIGKLSIGQAFAIGDPKDYPTYTSELNFVNKEKSGVNINVLLNKGDVSLNVNTKEYVINYDDQGDKQFNPNAKIELIDLEVVLRDFKSKTDLAKSIIKNLKNKGYKVLVDGEYNALFAKDNNVIRVYCHERNAYSGINIWENNDNMSIEWQTKSCKESDEKINEKLKSEL
jgi:hypothetical protein